MDPTLDISSSRQAFAYFTELFTKIEGPSYHFGRRFDKEMPQFLDYSFWVKTAKSLQNQHPLNQDIIHVRHSADAGHNIIEFKPEWHSKLAKLLEGTFIAIESVLPIIDSLKAGEMPVPQDIFPGAEYDDTYSGLIEESDFTTLRVALRHKSEAFKKLGFYNRGPDRSIWDYLASWPCFTDEDGYQYMDPDETMDYQYRSE